MTWRKGYRIVDLCELARQMNCKQCSSLLDLNQTKREARFGFASVLHVVCKCGVTNQVHTSRRQANAEMKTAYVINIKTSISMRQHCRLMAKQVCKFLIDVGIPVTTDVFDTTAKESTILSLSENTMQFPPLTLCPESQSCLRTEHGQPFKHEQSEEDMDVLESNSIFYGERVLPSTITRASFVQEINTETKADNTGSVEESGEIWEVEVCSDTSDEKEDGLEEIVVTFDQTQSAPLKQASIKSQRRVHMPSPPESESAEEHDVQRNTNQAEDNDKYEKRTTEMECGQSSSYKVPAVMMATATHGHHMDARSSNPTFASSSQHLEALPKAKHFRRRGRRDVVKSFIVNDMCAPFMCDECGARFASATALTLHKKVHSNRRNLLRCDRQEHFLENDMKQAEGFQERDKETAYHFQDAHDLSYQYYKMGSCHQKESDPNSSEVITTSREGQGSQKLQDIVTCRQTNEDDAAENHSCTSCSGAEKSFKCGECSAAFDRSSALERHLIVHFSERLFMCVECSAGFSKDEDLSRHVSRVHRTRGAFSCPECNATLATATSLKHHMRTHTGETPFKCDVCDKLFTESSALRAHMRRHDGNLPHVCQDCGKAFAFVSGLNNHRIVHSGQRPYSCQECKATFTCVASLNLHMRIHTDERSFSCEICNKSFRQSSSLHRHLWTHSREKSFLCQDCGKVLANKYTLKVHRKMHTGERPLKCPSCPASFSQHGSLNTHMNLHNGERFLCEICQKSFRSLHYLNQHKELHTGEKLVCQQCGKAVLGKLRLQAHLRAHTRFLKQKKYC